MDKGFLIVSLINFTITLIFYLLMVTIAAYAVEHFNASTSTAGLVSSIFIIGTLLGRLGTGRIIGDWGSKNIILRTAIIYVVNDVLFYSRQSIAADG